MEMEADQRSTARQHEALLTREELARQVHLQRTKTAE
jgi:hypothetical protein